MALVTSTYYQFQYSWRPWDYEWIEERLSSTWLTEGLLDIKKLPDSFFFFSLWSTITWLVIPLLSYVSRSTLPKSILICSEHPIAINSCLVGTPMVKSNAFSDSHLSNVQFFQGPPVRRWAGATFYSTLSTRQHHPEQPSKHSYTRWGCQATPFFSPAHHASWPLQKISADLHNGATGTHLPGTGRPRVPTLTYRLSCHIDAVNSTDADMNPVMGSQRFQLLFIRNVGSR